MSEGMKVSLSNPLGAFLGALAMFLAGIAIGARWHPSPTIALAITVLAAVLAGVHELVSCFLWCSLTAWWIGRRSAALERRR